MEPQISIPKRPKRGINHLFKRIEMTLSEYIQKEFGIIPDETQIEEIKKIVIDSMNKNIAGIYEKYAKFDTSKPKGNRSP